MAAGRIPDGQKTLPFALADGSARDRRVQLARAVHDLRLDSDAKLLALLVYDMTAEGIGEAWTVPDEVVMGHALGPECGKTHFYETHRALAEAGILSVITDRAEGNLRRRYKVFWEGVYAVRGLPLPDNLREPGDEDFRTANDSPGENSPRENSRGENSPRENPAGECQSAPDAHARTHAQARLSSCLVFLSNVDVDDMTLRQDIARKACEILAAIFAEKPGAKLDRDTSRFAAEVAAVAVVAGDEWSAWIDYAVAVTANKKGKHTPGSYLRNTMRQSLIEFAGVCKTEIEAAAIQGSLLAAVRPIARAVLASERIELPAAVPRYSRPRNRLPNAEQIADGRSLMHELVKKVKCSTVEAAP